MEEGAKIKRQRRNWSLQKYTAELDGLEDYLLKECEDFYRCRYCTLIMHENAMWNEPGTSGCFNCIESREASAKWALLAFLVCLKRNHCHKDVYENIFIPLTKGMRKEAWKREEWDAK